MHHHPGGGSDDDGGEGGEENEVGALEEQRGIENKELFEEVNEGLQWSTGFKEIFQVQKIMFSRYCCDNIYSAPVITEWLLLSRLLFVSLVMLFLPKLNV